MLASCSPVCEFAPTPKMTRFYNPANTIYVVILYRVKAVLSEHSDGCEFGRVGTAVALYIGDQHVIAALGDIKGTTPDYDTRRARKKRAGSCPAPSPNQLQIR